MQNKLSTNLIYQMSYQVLVFIYPLITIPIISKAFGPEVLGIYSYTYAVSYYFSLLAALGIHNYGNRQVAFHRDEPEELKQIFNQLYSLQLLCAIVTCVIYICYVFTIGRQYREAALCQGILIITSMADVSWFFSGLERFKIMVFRNIGIKIFSLIFIYCFVHTEKDLITYILIVTLTGLLGQLVIFPSVVTIIGRLQLGFKGVTKHMLPTLRLFLPVIAINSYTVIDKAILGIFRTMDEVGYYENSERLIRMPVGLVNAACAVMLPRAAYFIAHKDSTKNNDLVLKTMRYMLILVIPTIWGLIGIAPEFIPWYMGDNFYPCIEIISLLAPILFFMTVSSVLRLQFYIPNELDTPYTISTVGSTLINLCISLLLTKQWGIFGIICGSLLSEAFAMIYLLWYSRNQIRFIKLLRFIIACNISAGLMYFVVRRIGINYGVGAFTNVFQIFLGAIVYILLLLSSSLFLNCGRAHSEKD